MKTRIGICAVLVTMMWLAPTLVSAAPSGEARPAEWATVVDPAMNLFQVAPRFYRSARLDEEDLPRLRSLGIRTVVSLRAFHSDTRLLSDTGIGAVRVPMLTWSIDDDEVVRALRAIRTAETRGPVLLHCQHGADRTGLVTAMYRMVVQGWPREAALDELQNGGFGYHSMWKNIPTYLETVDVDVIRAKLDALSRKDGIASN
jgi:protein tyrosine/serine phosphatase